MAQSAPEDPQPRRAAGQPLDELPGVVRTKTEIAMRQRVPYRLLPLLQGRPGQPPA